MANEVRLVRTDVLKEYFCAACSTHKRYKRTVEECRNYTDSYGNGCFKMRLIDNTPSAPPETLRPTGRWTAINADCRGYADAFECSRCETISYTHTYMKECEFEFCPVCGAKMMVG